MYYEVSVATISLSERFILTRQPHQLVYMQPRLSLKGISATSNIQVDRVTKEVIQYDLVLLRLRTQTDTSSAIRV